MNIYDENDYSNAMKRIEELIAQNPQESSPAFKELNRLGALVSEYEDILFPIKIK